MKYKLSPDGTFDLTVPSDPTLVESLQEFFQQQLLRHHFDEKELFGIRLSLEEGIVNAIKHGNKQSPDKVVRLTGRFRPHEFRIVIEDQGPGFCPDDVADCLDPDNWEKPSGRGLLLMRHYMAEVTYHPPGNRLEMVAVSKNGDAADAQSSRAKVG